MAKTRALFDGSGDSKRVVRQRSHWYRYGIFVSTTTLLTFLVAANMPRIVKDYVIGCTNPNCFDASLAISRSLDTVSADPCDDFYGFVCGGWQRAYPGSSNLFQGLQQRVASAVIMSLVLEDAAGDKRDPTKQVALLFQKCAQLAFGEQEHIAELREFLGRFSLSWPTPKPRSKLETLDLLVTLSLDWGVPVLFQLTVDPYFKRKGFRMLHFSSNPYMTEWFMARNALMQKGSLLTYFHRVSLILAGTAVSKGIVEKVLELDNKVLSTIVPSVLDPRPDFDLKYVTIKDLDDTMGPYLTSTEWLQVVNSHLPVELGLEDEMFVMNNRLFRLVGHLISRKTDMEILLPYVTWHLARHFAPMTSYSLSHAQFVDDPGLGSATLGYMVGRCYVDTDAHMPFAFAHLFIKRWLSRRVVDNAARMVDHIRKVANATMVASTCMDDETKTSALDKLHTLRAIVGYPSDLNSVAALKRHYQYSPQLNGTYFQMVLTLRAAELSYMKRFLRKNGSGVVSDMVNIPLTLVNAFYVPVYHVMVIPAAILYSPFYVDGYPSSYNFGSLGHVVGHEITHAFDPDMGLFDRDGVRRNWWTPESRALFERRLDCLRELYNPLPWGGGINFGDHALSENFADCGGMLKVYQAFHGSQAKKNRPLGESLAKFTDEQLFFISSCFKWCSNNEKQTPGWYSPPRMRCNVPLMNMPEFAKAFRCGAGKAMNPSRRCDFL
ncbi:unnamed protein product [Ixodes hexagonus]